MVAIAPASTEVAASASDTQIPRITELYTIKPEVAERLQAAKAHLEGGMQHVRLQSQDMVVAHLAGGNWKAAQIIAVLLRVLHWFVGIPCPAMM